MPDLTQLGTNLFLGSTYSVVVWTDDHGQTWVSHHTDKSRSYKTDWDAKKVAETIADGKTAHQRQQEQYKSGVSSARSQAKLEHNRLPWWKRVKKK